MPSTKKKESPPASGKRRLVFDVDSDDPHHPHAVATPASTTAVPEKASRKRGIKSYLSSPDTKKKKKAAVVTPSVQTKKQAPEYIPTYIHKNLAYGRVGKSTLHPTKLNAFELIADNFDIPADMEQDRSFGPQSGTTFEERAIQAYALGKLSPKGKDVAICTSCATLGHMRDECPTLI